VGDNMADNGEMGLYRLGWDGKRILWLSTLPKEI